MASKQVGIGLIGLGFMGLTHLRAAQQVRGGRVVALVTNDARKAKGDFSKVQGNFGDAGARENLEGISIYSSLEEMLADDKVDMVDICLPSYLHTKAAIRVLKAGKTALVEKPIALKPSDAKRMIDASKKTGSMLLVAQVLKFFPEFAALASAVRSKKYGELRALHCRRVIAKPNWAGDNWLADPKRSGGMVIDLHIHDTDFAVYLFGRPKAVHSTGIVEDGQIQSLRTTYDFGRRGPLISSEAGWINAPSLPFEHGYDAWFEKGTVRFNSTTCPTPQLFGAKKARDFPLPRGTDGFANEIQAAVDSVRKGEVDPRLSPVSAAISLEVALAEAKAVKSRRPVSL